MMAEVSGSHVSGATHNIYTVLLGVAFLVLLIGVGYVWYRYAELFDTPNPFSVSQAAVEAVRTAFLA